MACPGGRGRFDGGSSSASEQEREWVVQSRFPIARAGLSMFLWVDSQLWQSCVSTHWPQVVDLGKSIVREVSGTGICTKFLMHGSGSDTRVRWSGFEFLQIT